MFNNSYNNNCCNIKNKDKKYRGILQSVKKKKINYKLKSRKLKEIMI